MKRILCVLGFAWAGAAAQSPEEFQALATVAAARGEGVQRLELPFEAHRWTRSDLADVRLFDAKGEAMPFAFGAAPRPLPANEQTAVHVFPIRSLPGGKGSDVRLDVRVSGDGTLVALRTQGGSASSARFAGWVLDATGTRDPVGAIVLEWEAKAGAEVARVSVESSEDLATWQSVGTGAVLALSDGGERLSQPRVAFSPRKVKYLRITSPTEGFVLKSARLERRGPTQAPAARTVQAAGQAGAGAGEFVFDLGAAVPVRFVNFAFAQANTIAPVQVYSRPDAASPWRVAGAATFYRLVRGGEEVRSPPLELGPLAHRFWMARIDPKAGTIDAPRLEAGYIPVTLVFAARGEGPFRIAFGHADAAAANLPLATLIPGYESGAEHALPMASVQDLHPQAAAAGWSWRKLVQGRDRAKIVLWVILVAAVALLAFMAWRIHRQLG
jgi:hypothetical protein